LYHCAKNRFDAITDYSKLVHTAVNSSMVVPPPTIDVSEYTPELVKKMTDNYRLPILIKGLFKVSCSFFIIIQALDILFFSITQFFYLLGIYCVKEMDS
jgi:hypothetical protein